MSKPTKHEFDLDVYNQGVRIYTGNMSEVLKRNNIEDCDDADAVSLKEDGWYCIAFQSDETKTARVQAHEAVHIATMIYKDIGAYHDLDNQEPFAYLVGHIADLINSTRKCKKTE